MRLSLFLSLVLGAFVIACGRPATTEECQEIVGRIAELELKNASITNPEEVKERVHETQEAFHDRAMKECVGRRITEKALSCVRNANTAEQIVEECFD